MTLGSTAWSTTSGRYGIPRIAASGNTVVVAWLSNSSGTVKARVSTDAGRTWSATGGLTGSSTDIPAVAALGTRAAVAWTDGSSAVVRTWSAGAWSSPRSTGTPTGADVHALVRPGHRAQRRPRASASRGRGCVTTCETWSSSHARQPRLERIDGTAERPGSRARSSDRRRASIGSPVQRLSLDPVAIRHGPPCALERRDGRNERIPDRPPDRDRPGRRDGRKPGRAAHPIRTQRRPHHLARNRPAISRSALTDRPGNRKSACRLAGALPSGLGIVTRRP